MRTSWLAFALEYNLASATCGGCDPSTPRREGDGTGNSPQNRDCCSKSSATVVHLWRMATERPRFYSTPYPVHCEIFASSRMDCLHLKVNHEPPCSAAPIRCSDFKVVVGETKIFCVHDKLRARCNRDWTPENLRAGLSATESRTWQVRTSCDSIPFWAVFSRKGKKTWQFW